MCIRDSVNVFITLQFGTLLYYLFELVDHGCKHFKNMYQFVRLKENSRSSSLRTVLSINVFNITHSLPIYCFM